MRGFDGCLKCLAFALPTLLSAQTMSGLPPVHRSGKQLVFAGAGQDWPARLLSLEHGKVRLTRTLGFPAVKGAFKGPAILWRERLQVLDWNRVEGSQGPEVIWTLHERGLAAEDGWKVAREGKLHARAKVKALLPLDEPDTYLVVGWLYHLEGAGRNLPAHRVKVTSSGTVEVLESLGPDKDDLVQVLLDNRSAMGDLVIHGDPEGRWILLHPASGLLWVVDGKGRHRHTFAVSAQVTPAALREKRAPLQVIIQSQPTEEGTLWIQARNEDCLEAASFQETRRRPEAQSPVPPPADNGIPPVTEMQGTEAWRQEIDEVIRRHPRLRWIEYNPATRTAKEMATAPVGAVDVAMTFHELLSAMRWIPGELGQVIPMPDVLMPWADAADMKKPDAPGRAAPEGSKVGPSAGPAGKPAPVGNTPPQKTPPPAGDAREGAASARSNP